MTREDKLADEPGAYDPAPVEKVAREIIPNVG